MQHRGSAGTRRAREAGVVGDARRLDALREARQPIEMPACSTASAAPPSAKKFSEWTSTKPSGGARSITSA